MICISRKAGIYINVTLTQIATFDVTIGDIIQGTIYHVKRNASIVPEDAVSHHGLDGSGSKSHRSSVTRRSVVGKGTIDDLCVRSVEIERSTTVDCLISGEDIIDEFDSGISDIHCTTPTRVAVSDDTVID